MGHNIVTIKTDFLNKDHKVFLFPQFHQSSRNFRYNEEELRRKFWVKNVLKPC